MLAVDVDQLVADGTQVPERHGPVIDESAGSSVRADGAPQAAQIIVVELAFGEPLAGRMVGRQLEGEADFGTLAAGADCARVGAIAEGESERVDENRLAGTRFAGHDREPGAHLDFDVVDNRVITDAQQGEHVRLRQCSRRLPRPQLSFDRSSS